MGRDGLSREQQKKRTRERLIEASARVFIEKGFDGASLEEIAATADLTRGAIYSNFANKEELFLAAARSRAVQPDVDAFDSENDFSEQLAAFGRSVLAVEKRAREQAALEFEVARVALCRPTVRTAIARSQKHSLETLARHLETAASASGIELSLPPKDAAAALIGLCRGLLVLRLLAPGAIRDDLVSDAIVQLVIGAEARRIGRPTRTKRAVSQSG